MSMKCGVDMDPNVLRANTIYVQNLNEKVNQKDLKFALYSVFSSFGKVLEVVSAKTYRLRGQAWVVFDNQEAAANALQFLEGFTFYDKHMHLSYALQASDALVLRSGSTVDRPRSVRLNRKLESQEKEKAAKRRIGFNQSNSATASQREEVIGSRTLCVHGLPATTTNAMLRILFEQFPGFESAGLMQGTVGLAHILFQTVEHATVALNGLQGFRLNPTHTLVLSFFKE